METLLAYDTSLFLWLNEQRAAWLDPIMFAISGKVLWLPLYITLIFLIFRTKQVHSWGALLTLILVIAWADGITSHVMKPYFQRLRPTHEPAIQEQVYIVNDYRGGQYSFASGHAANSFGVACILWLLFRGIWTYVGFMFLWAALVSYSRIYLGVHYPLDILVGAGVGILGARLGYLFYRYIFEKNKIPLNLSPFFSSNKQTEEKHTDD